MPDPNEPLVLTDEVKDKLIAAIKAENIIDDFGNGLSFDAHALAAGVVKVVEAEILDDDEVIDPNVFEPAERLRLHKIAEDSNRSSLQDSAVQAARREAAHKQQRRQAVLASKSRKRVTYSENCNARDLKKKATARKRKAQAKKSKRKNR